MESIVKAEIEYLDIFLEMGLELWPGHEEEELRSTLSEILQTDKDNVLFYRLDDQFVAFIYLSIRTDYVEGSNSSPTGYIEGIYVKPPYRRKGISRKLMQAGESWFKERGCKQVGSDAYIHNTTSHEFHRSVGFKEAGRLVAFIKDLD